MNVKKLIIAFICVLSLFNQNTEAQKIKRQLEYSGFFDSYYFRGPVAITVGIGMVGYKGDLCGGLACNTLKPIFSLIKLK